MSRNFDLMQQLEIDRGPHPTESVAPVFPTSPGNANRNGHVEWASDEALRLVQQIFLLKRRSHRALWYLPELITAMDVVESAELWQKR